VVDKRQKRKAGLFQTVYQCFIPILRAFSMWTFTKGIIKEKHLHKNVSLGEGQAKVKIISSN